MSIRLRLILILTLATSAIWLSAALWINISTRAQVTDYQAAAERGKADGSSLSFTLTIISDDLDPDRTEGLDASEGQGK